MTSPKKGVSLSIIATGIILVFILAMLVPMLSYRARLQQIKESGDLEPGSPEAADAARRESLLQLIFVLPIFFLMIVGVLLFRRSLRTSIESGQFSALDDPLDRDGESFPPLTKFTTTYVLADTHYAPTIDVKTPTGEVVGQCGVKALRPPSQAASNLVPAFLLWLSDAHVGAKSTKVLASPYIYNTPKHRDALAQHGPVTLMQDGQLIRLETLTLHLVARVIEVAYIPHDIKDDSFFETIQLELAVWPL